MKRHSLPIVEAIVPHKNTAFLVRCLTTCVHLGRLLSAPIKTEKTHMQAGHGGKAAVRAQISSFSIASFSCWICDFSWLPSLVVTEQEMTCIDSKLVSNFTSAQGSEAGADPVLSKHRPCDAARTAKRSLGGHKHVRHVLQCTQFCQFSKQDCIF